MSKSTLAAVYCRVSTEKEDQLNSLENQKRFFLGYMQRNTDFSLYRIYADRGISGTAAKNRKEFKRMIEDARNGSFGAIITKEVSRFSRNILDAISYTRELKKLGIRVIFMNDGIDTFQPDSELRLSIMAGFAQEESRKISDRVKWGQTRSMEAGVVFGSSMLGYKVEKGRITVEPEGAKIVKEIYEKYLLQGLSAANIACRLNSRGIRTFHNKSFWNPSVIMKILKNEKYCGNLKQKKTYTPDYLTHEKRKNHGEEDFIFIKNHHEAIIKPEMWEAVQTEIKRRTKGKSVSKARGTKFPLSGKIFCGVCGSAFVCRRRYYGEKTVMVWKCSSAIKEQKVSSGERVNPCHSPVSRQLKNDDCIYMIKYSISLLFSEGKLSMTAIKEKLLSLLLDARRLKADEKSKSREQLQSEIKALQNKKLSLLDLYLSKGITDSDMKTLKEKYEEEIKKKNEVLACLDYKYHHISTQKALNRELENSLSLASLHDCDICNCAERLVFYPDGTAKLKLKYLPEIYSFSVLKKKQKNTFDS